MRDPNRIPDPEDEFFVGYLDTPTGLTRFSLGVAVGLLLLGAGIAAAASALQRSPGAITEGETELIGVVVREPYGMLRHLDEAGDVHHVLLVRGGKFGAPLDAVRTLEGQAASASGLLLTRDGDGLLELHGALAPAALDDETRAALTVLEETEVGDVTLIGEIVDSKCYYGRMRPGGGRTHRACAQLCVRGNIPPVLVTHDASGRERHYLLANLEGRSIAQDVLEFLAEPVRVTGSLRQIGDLAILRVDPASIERL